MNDFVSQPPPTTVYAFSPVGSQHFIVNIGDTIPFPAVRLTLNGQQQNVPITASVLSGGGVQVDNAAGRLFITGASASAVVRLHPATGQVAADTFKVDDTLHTVVPMLARSFPRPGHDTAYSLRDTVQIMAKPSTLSGAAISGAPMAWRIVSGGGFVTMLDSIQGLFRAEANGDAVVRAVSDSATLTDTIRVRQRATKLAIGVQPTTVAPGAQISPAVSVLVQDARGNTVSASSASVTVALGSNPAGGALSGTATVSATNGVATFANLSVDRAGSGYTLVFASSGLTGATSAAFNVTTSVGPPAQLTFGVQPSNATSGAAISPAVTVTVRDAQGSVVTTATNSITITLGGNPAGGALTGTTTVGAVNGVATFNNLVINKAGSGYTLAASASGLSGAASNSFAVTAAAASKLAFTVQPSNTSTGAAIAPAVQVSVQDAQGNTVTSATTSIAVAIGNNPAGGALSGTVTAAAQGGIASFANLSIDKAGSGYTLTAAASGLTGATSGGFNVSQSVGPPAQLAFSTQPTNVASGAAISPAVTVTVQDAQGFTVTSATTSITVTIGSNPGAGMLSGTTTVAAVNGVASFSTLSIDKAGTGYTLAAAATGLTGASSAAFNVTAGARSKLAFSVQPTNAAAGAAISPAVQVIVQDAAGNTVTSGTTSVTVALGANPANGTLAGTLTQTTASGVATFANLSVNKTGTGYTLAASASGLTGATSNSFNVSAGAASKLAFTAQPGITQAGTTISPAVQVTVQDAQGNTVTSSTASVTVAIGTNPGGGTLSGTATAAAANGVAVFANLSIDKAGSGYTLTAASSALTGATSSAFDVTAGAPGRLAFTVQPSNTAAGTAIAPAVKVTVQDSQGNTVTGSSASITLAISTNPSAGTLTGTTTVSAVSGVATFANLSIDKVGNGYALSASASGLMGAASAAFNVTPGAASKLVFSGQPSNAAAGAAISPAVAVTIQDAQGNTVTGATTAITVAIGNNPSGGTLSGTRTVQAVNGVASFADLSIDKAGSGYTLAASSSGLTAAASNAFAISAGAPSRLAYMVQPTSSAAGVAISPAVKVAVLDAQGNTVTGATTSITVAIGTNPAGGTLGGTKTVAAVSGVATFSDLTIDKTGTGYTLAASATGLAGATSNAFNITPGAGSRLAFSVQPTTTAAGSAISPPVQVTVFDAQGNIATGSSASITVAIGTNPSGGALSGTTTLAAVNGVANFPDLSINRNGAGYTLTAAATSLAGATSSAFDITVGAASKLAFSVQPTNTASGATMTPAVKVTVQDAQGNTVTSSSAAVTVAIGNNPSAGTLSGTKSVAAASGIATFGDLSIDNAGTAYTLTAAATGLTGATSAAFNVTVGAASKLAFSVQPSSAAAGAAISPAVKVTVQDAQGNTVTGSTASITVAIGTNPSGGTLSGTKTVAAVNGVASFADLSVDKVGNGYTLAASTGGLSGATSSAFNISTGAASKLAFTVQPSNAAAGAAISPPVQVTIQDAQGNTVPSSASITLAFGTNPSNGTLSGTASVAAVNGVASFGDLSIDKAGSGYTLAANSSGLTGATSAAFNVGAGAASKLVFSVQPSSAAAGAAISPAVQVTVQDAQGNTVASTASITVAIGANPSSGTLSGTVTQTASNGVATFGDLSIDKVGNAYTLTAASSGLAGATSSAFNITTGAANRLAFTVQPSNAAAGAVISPAVQVTVQDAQGNTVPSTASITVAIGTNPAGGTLAGTKTVAAVNGVATFGDLSLDKAGTGYTLAATATGLTGATSAAFNVSAGAASRLAFSVQPSNAAAGAAISPAVQVTVQDAQGNTVTGSTASITVAIGTNPSSGTLSGTTTVAAVSGVASFANLSIDKAGTGYTLAAASSGLTAATSAAFNIGAGGASKLVFSVQPSSAAAGAAISPAVQVSVQDAQGNTVTSSTASITMAIGTNPSAGTLSGTTTVSAVNGVATFGNLSIDKAGTGYTLSASSSGLAGATSSAFNITSGAANRLAFTVQPSNAAAGAAISPPVQVTIQDAQGNTVSSSASITVAIGTNPAGGTLAGTKTVAAVNGVATFADLSIDKTGTGYTLAATGSGLTGATSSAFNISAGAASRLAFSVQPSNAAAGAAISPAVQVTVQDAQGNTVTGSTASITVAIGSNPSSGTLSGTTTVAAVSGVASFANLSIDKVGTGYTLAASSSGLTAATSAAFNITAGGANRLVFSVQPSNAAAGATISPAVQVTVQDAQGNTVTGSSASITLAIGTNPSAGTLSGTTTVSAVNGVASFANLSIDKAGTGYTLSASSSGLTGATSSAFNVSAGAASKLAFSVQPSNAASGAAISPAVQVTVQDAQGNTVSSTASITMAIGTNPAGGTLSGTATVSAVNGVASFGDLSIDKAGTGYTLAASSSGLTGSTSTAFSITAGAGSRLVFSVQPSNTAAGAAISPAVQVSVQDAQGNTVTSSNASVTVAIGANPAGGALSGTATVSAVNGVASFGDLSIDKVGTGYTLTASSSGLTGATSAAFNITAGAASKLVFSVQPSNVTAGASISPAVQVTVQDARGNTVTGSTASVSMAIGTNAGGGTLSGTTTVSAVNGVATFGNLSVDKVGTGYTLAASSSGLAGATSAAFNVTTGSATQLVFSVQPTSATAGAAISPAVQVTVQDAQGNTVTTASASITVAIGTNAGGGTLSGTLTVSAVNGVATFSDLSINKAGSGYTLAASSSGLTPATSSAFDINAGAASALVFTVQPSNTPANQAITPAVQVSVTDAFGNLVRSGTFTVTVAIGANPSGGTLSGTTSGQTLSGVVSFPLLSIDRTGIGYTLTASAISLTTATSSPFDITP